MRKIRLGGSGIRSWSAHAGCCYVSKTCSGISHAKLSRAHSDQLQKARCILTCRSLRATSFFRVPGLGACASIIRSHPSEATKGSNFGLPLPPSTTFLVFRPGYTIGVQAKMRTATTLSALALASSVAADCNGRAEYCGRPYSQVTFAGSHNSAFVGVGPSDNQLTSVSAQLDQGIRFLTTQTHDKDGVIEMCHTVSRA